MPSSPLSLLASVVTNPTPERSAPPQMRSPFARVRELLAASENPTPRIDPVAPPAVKPAEDEDLSPKGFKQIITDEGEKLKPYKDTKGIYTVGVGFNLEEADNIPTFKQIVGVEPQEFIKSGASLTKEQSRALLDHEVKQADTEIRQLVPGFEKLPPDAQDALTNFMYNVGMTTAREFKKTLAAVNRGDGAAAAAGLRKSAYYKQVGARGERVAKALESIGAK